MAVYAQTPTDPMPVLAECAARRIATLQVALDRRFFSPGCIDNRLGSQTKAALRAWQEANNLPATGDLDDTTGSRLTIEAPAFATYQVTARDVAQLGKAPEDWRERAAQPSLPYESILELVAERFHTTQRFLRELNPGINWATIKAATAVEVPNVATETLPPRAAALRIILDKKWVLVYGKDEQLCAFFPCSIGRDKMRIPVGRLRIADLAPSPNYTFDPKVFPESPAAQEIKTRLIIPAGPNNPVGVMWLSIGRPPDSTDPPLSGYGIHGTPKPEDIGKTESHGCFRLANWNAERLAAMISIGTPVTVVEK